MQFLLTGNNSFPQGFMGVFAGLPPCYKGWVSMILIWLFSQKFTRQFADDSEKVNACANPPTAVGQ